MAMWTYIENRIVSIVSAWERHLKGIETIN